MSNYILQSPRQLVGNIFKVLAVAGVLAIILRFVPDNSPGLTLLVVWGTFFVGFEAYTFVQNHFPKKTTKPTITYRRFTVTPAPGNRAWVTTQLPDDDDDRYQHVCDVNARKILSTFGNPCDEKSLGPTEQCSLPIDEEDDTPPASVLHPK